ncbi:class I SAM-dependent methyltransferase [Streptosporangium sp. NPDC051022]|uniref:class I SAM-dependent methyltransferase n=1 Tax=Streptosporangium sp. NPDC051022 TaxID=3155752 RepID=UPI0034358A6B
MSRLTALRGRFVEAPDSLGAKARARRWHWLARVFPDIGDMTVIDLGGTANSWLRSPVKPARVHIVNLSTPPADLPPWMTVENGDACDLRAATHGTRYDLVFSNSVIEHVGGHLRREMFAEAVHSLADRHWVQTPYRYFPVEPHYIFPGLQFMPLAVRAATVRHWPLVHTRPTDKEGAVRSVAQVELLSKTEMRYYFPHSELRYEWLAGLVKALVAVKR